MQEFRIPKRLEASKKGNRGGGLQNFIINVSLDTDGAPLIEGGEGSEPVNFIQLIDSFENWNILKSPGITDEKFDKKYARQEFDKKAAELKDSFEKAFGGILTGLEMVIHQSVAPDDLPKRIKILRETIPKLDDFEHFISEQKQYSEQAVRNTQKTRNRPDIAQYDAETRAGLLEDTNLSAIKYNKEHPDHPVDAEDVEAVRKRHRKFQSGDILVAYRDNIKMYDDLLTKIENAKALLNGIALRLDDVAKNYQKTYSPPGSPPPPPPLPGHR